MHRKILALCHSKNDIKYISFLYKVKSRDALVGNLPVNENTMY